MSSSSTTAWMIGSACSAVAILASSFFVPPPTRRHFHRHFFWSGGENSTTATASVVVGTAVLVGSCWALLFRGIAMIRLGSPRIYGTPVRKEHAAGRRMGLLERWYVAHSRAGLHTGFCLCLELTSRDDDNDDYNRNIDNNQAVSLSLPELRTILGKVSRQFPWLRARVGRDHVTGLDSRTSIRLTTPGTSKNTTNDYVWGDDFFVEVLEANDDNANLCLPTIRQVLVEEEENDNDDEDYEHFTTTGCSRRLGDILEQESVQSWNDQDPNQPLWRVTLVQWNRSKNKCALILSFHHLITDGMGALEVARSIVRNITGTESNIKSNSSSLLFEKQEPLLPPPFEDVVDTTPRLGHIVLPVLLDRIPALQPYLQPPHWRGSNHRQHVVDATKPSILMCVILCEEEAKLDRWRDAASRAGLSFNSLLVGALVKVLARIVGDETDGGGMVRFKIQVAADERRRRAKNNVAAKRLGVYLTGPQLTLSVTDQQNDVVSLGKIFAEKLQKGLETSAMDIGLCKFIQEDWNEFARKFCHEKPHGVTKSLEVSHLKATDDHYFDHNNDSADRWRVDRLWFAQGHRGAGPAVTASIVSSTQSGNVHATLTAFPEVVTRATLEIIALAWKRELSLV